MIEQPDIRIENTTTTHLRLMAEVMKEDNAKTAIKLGISPRRALWKSWRNSVISKTVFINNEIAAIWGLAGSPFADVGFPWLVAAPCVDEYPMRTAFAYRRALNEMQEIFPELEDYVDSTDEKAIRMLTLMGFTIGREIIQRGECGMRVAVRRK